MLETSFTKLVGCEVPLQQAGMGRIASFELAAAVSEAGGLGMLGTHSGITLENYIGILDRLKATTKPFGVNFLVVDIDAGTRERIALAATRARVVEFFYGEPDASLIELVHQGGALVCWNTGSVGEALAAVKAGCDMVGVQGVEAGGHVRGTMGLLPLLNEVLEVVDDVPVIAAGGISSGRAMAGAMAAGAAAVRVGTRFVASKEADAHPDYVAALIAAKGEDTVFGETFSVGWPNAPHRALRSSVEAARAFKGEVVGEYLENDKWLPVPRFQPLGVSKDTRGSIEAMPLWAGQGAGAIKELKAAGDIVRELAQKAEELLRKW